MSASRGINVVLGLVVLLAVAGVSWLYSGGRSPATSETAGAVEPVTVIVGQARVRQLEDRIQALGTARASEAVEITPEVTGVIEDIRFEQGSIVEAGQVLATLEAADVEANLAAARAAVAQSRSAYEREQELYRSGLISDADLEQTRTRLRTARARVAVVEATLADHVIRAPFGGRLGLRRVSPGSLVQPGSVITTLDDITPIEAGFTVPGVFVGTLKPGQAVVARTAAYPDDIFTGTVQMVATRVDPVTRTIRVRAVLRNPSRLIKPGMLLTMRLIRNTSSALVVPEQAVVPQNDRQFVFVVEDGTAHRREVRTGRRRPGLVEITAGLSAGAAVIVEGTLKVRDGTPVARAKTVSGSTAEPAG